MGTDRQGKQVVPVPHHFNTPNHSIFSLSRIRPFSTAWVKLAKSLVSILDITHSSRSFGSVIDLGMRLRAMYGASLQKHINMVSHITRVVLPNKTYTYIGGEMSDSERVL